MTKAMFSKQSIKQIIKPIIKQILLLLLMIAALFLWLNLYSIAEAKDFGVLGHTYQISETDILKEIEARLTKIDMEQLNKKMATRTREYTERPPEVKKITVAKETREYFYDPSYTLEEDVKDHLGQIIHLAGTKVNPLAHVPLREALIFIDGDDQTQVELALKIRAEKQQKLKIILVKGSPLELQRKYKIWIYFDQAGVITTKFGIKEIPALVVQDGLQLKISILTKDQAKESEATNRPRAIMNSNIKQEKNNAKTLS